MLLNKHQQASMLLIKHQISIHVANILSTELGWTFNLSIQRMRTFYLSIERMLTFYLRPCLNQTKIAIRWTKNSGFSEVGS